MNEIKLTIRTFKMDGDKEAALKVLEEAAEAYNEWAIYYDAIALTEGETEPYPDYIIAHDFERFADEIADCIQACVNLADRYGIDLTAAMERCEKRNRERGRYEH